MTRNVITASPGTSVLAARRLLTLHGIRHLPIVVDGKVVGIVSDRDIRINDREIVASLSALHSDLVSGRYRRVSSVMTTPVQVIRPKMKLSIAALFMASRRIDALPVVEDGKLVGIISLTDCVRALAAQEGGVHADTARAPEPGPRMPTPAGDPRDGRPRTQRVALVVEPDPARRMQAAAELTAAGYAPVTCPGPAAGTYCPAVHDPGSLRCPRVPQETELVLVRDDEHAAALQEAYSRWLPEAAIRVTSATGA